MVCTGGSRRVSNCSCWQMSIGHPVLFEYGTGCEWHPSNQTLQCPVVTIRCYPWSAGSWQLFHIVGLCVFSHQSADYRMVVAHLTSNSFEGHPCCMHADYLPSLCFDILLCTMLTENEYLVFKTLDLNTQIRSVNILNKGNNKITELRTILQREFWVMRERHGSRAWLVDIRHNGHTCVSTSF
jgi:hypothetical protein